MGRNNGKIIMVSDVDLSKFAGDTCRTSALATELANIDLDVTLVVPKPSNGEIMVNCCKVKLVYVSIEQINRSGFNIIKRRIELIKKVNQLKQENSLIICETSVLGGYFSLFGRYRDYILDVHGIAYDEVSFAKFPWYMPKFIYKKFIYLLERVATKRACMIIAVSNSMANFINQEWKIPKAKIRIIPNGFFEHIVNGIVNEKIERIPRSVTFVGHLASWANIERIINAAKRLKNDNISFYIVGDGLGYYVKELKDLVKSNGLNNVIFTGKVTLENAYKLIAASDVLILPFPKSLCTDVACPIKIIEYMAFGKPMVLDGVSDLAKLLGFNDAALVADYKNEKEFAVCIERLINDCELRSRIGINAKLLSNEYSWKVQGRKLYKIIKNYVNKNNDTCNS